MFCQKALTANPNANKRRSKPEWFRSGQFQQYLRRYNFLWLIINTVFRVDDYSYDKFINYFYSCKFVDISPARARVRERNPLSHLGH